MEAGLGPWLMFLDVFWELASAALAKALSELLGDWERVSLRGSTIGVMGAMPRRSKFTGHNQCLLLFNIHVDLHRER